MQHVQILNVLTVLHIRDVGSQCSFCYQRCAVDQLSRINGARKILIFFRLLLIIHPSLIHSYNSREKQTTMQITGKTELK